MPKLKDYFDKHKGEDIYVLGAGPSLDFISDTFFENKIVIGVNDIFRYFKCDYVIAKDCNENPRFGNLMKDISKTNIPFFYSEYYKGQKNLGLNKVTTMPNSIMFQHNRRNKPLEEELKSIDGDKILVSKSTILSGIYLAFKMGAKNIILCGNDAGKIDGNLYYSKYVQKSWKSSGNWGGIEKFVKTKDNGTLILKKYLNEKGVNLYSLNPFINFRLEGHSFTIK